MPDKDQPRAQVGAMARLGSALEHYFFGVNHCGSKTTRTSSHSAIWLARQFLKRPAVSAWVAERMASR